MSLDEIIAQSTKDLAISSTNSLAVEAIRAPAIFSKYMKEYVSAKGKWKALEREKAKVARELFLYYSGKADPAVLKRKGPIDFKILKSDIDTFIKADPEMVEVQTILDELDLKVEVLGNIVRQVKDRDWNIRNAVEYLKFSNGG